MYMPELIHTTFLFSLSGGIGSTAAWTVVKLQQPLASTQKTAVELLSGSGKLGRHAVLPDGEKWQKMSTTAAATPRRSILRCL